jgi:phosphotransferase system  glucose/maltose/N-acetylglucosamine-specific IIC component
MIFRFGGQHMNAIKRFGSAMIVPVLMFAFFGIILGFATLFKNPTIMGGLADSHTFWFGQSLNLVVGLSLITWKLYL